MDKKLVIISGMHRSGTSALAKVLIDLGFDAGKNLMSPSSDNPFGFWEDIEIFNLNNNILNALFLTWDQVENNEKRRIEFFIDEIWGKFYEQANKTINAKFEQSNLIVIKDPRFSILYPFWNKLFDKVEAEVYFIHMHRNPLSVAKSLKIRNGISIPNGLLLWYYYNVSTLKDLDKPICFISYHEMLNHPQAVLKKIVSFTGIQTVDNQNQFEHIVSKTLHKDLDHHQVSEEELDHSSTFFPEISHLWRIMSQYSEKQSIVIEHSKLISFFKADILNYITPNHSAKFFAILHCHNSRTEEPHKIIRLQYKLGKTKLRFELDNSNSYDEFHLHICDKPCHIILERIIINTSDGSEETHSFSGNFVYNQNNHYFFSSNSPFLQIKLSTAKNVQSIVLYPYIEILEMNVAEILIPVFQNQYLSSLHKHHAQIAILEEESHKRITDNERLSREAGDIIEELQKRETENERLSEEIGEIKDELQKRETENERLSEEVEKYKTEIIQLEKKSLWLYNEYNILTNSISWKITFPFRWGIMKLRKVRHFGSLIKTDLRIGFNILKRDGLSGFLYRLYWYLMGKRLTEDIDLWKKKNNLAENEIDKIDTSAPIELPLVDNPLVSIIIPVHNQWPYTYNCLKSIKDNTEDVCYEVIVADDKSTDKTRDILNVIKNVRLIRNDKNLGFLQNCNNAAHHANGQFIHFLNNDTMVHPEWLSSLVKIMDSSDQVGLVGSKLIYPDGKLQEAGGIIWNDATGWNYGRLDHPEKSEYNYLKEVDYVSAASILVKKTVWDELGGFDELFFPAYYEDTDLAYRIRGLGLRVMYQPMSVVTHFEGISNGTDEASGFKKFQVENRKKFLKKWHDVLQGECSPNGKNVFFHRDRSFKKKQMLVIDHYVPHFDQDAGSRSTFSYLKLFVKMGYNVKFIGDNFYRHQPYTNILQQIGVEVLYGDYYQKNIWEWIKENGQCFDYIIAHRMHIAPKYLDFLKKHSSAKLAYVGHDLQFVSSLRKYEFTKDENHQIDSAQFKQVETKIFNTVDVIFPFSTYETTFIKKIVPDKIVRTIPVYFYDNMPKVKTKFIERKDILFIGFFGHPPNVDAIVWFVKEIFPLVQKSIPGVKLHIVGSKPTKEVRELEDESIEVTGYVSDKTLKDLYLQCKVAILPLRFGAGVKGKLLESLYYQLPCVITSVAAEGIAEIEKYTFIANEPEQFAEKIHLLYTDENTWNKYSSRGKELIRNYFTEESARKIMEEVFGKVS